MPNAPITYTVMRRQGRPNWEVQWTDPATGRKKTRSTGHKVKREAERWASKFADDLNRGAGGPVRTTWADFRKQFSDGHLAHKRPNTAAKYETVLASVERHLNPKLLTALTPAALDEWAGKMAAAGNSANTVATNLRHLKAALRWAHDRGLLAAPPKVTVPPVESAAKGRPLTDAEFDRLLDATEPTVGADRAAGWRFLLRGLWLSGLRISEAAALTWDDRDGVHLRLGGKFPALFIPGRMQKGKRDTVTPLTPDFVALLETVPAAERTGFVFDLPLDRGGRAGGREASKTVGDIGRASGVAVKPGKTATAHDLRRSFCFRWAQRVLPQHLKALARHRTIDTTLRYYAEADAELTAEAVAAAVKGSGVSGAAT
ncbi:tyrosine-type recombinase/integrase [Alienimonas sp. DA493]|uniref:tyrosine-type recombinase/integrase n=1 Tax=Alienimonas sp. DA493 TaxID=3373605 RepID=UPI0037544355